MTHPLVVHIHHDAFDQRIDRQTMWGNPFTVQQYGRDRALQLYRRWLAGELHRPKLAARRQAVLDSVDELEGLTLGCWCSPSDCHGDILAALANGEMEVREL